MATRGIVSVDKTCVALALMSICANAAIASAQTSPPNAAPVASGRTVYEQRCAACHGANAEGAPGWEQSDAQGEMPAPPHDRAGHTWKHSDAMLYRIVQDGWRDPFNKTQRLTMPGFKGQLSRADTIAVIAYLKTLWTPEQREFQAEESRRAPFPRGAP